MDPLRGLPHQTTYTPVKKHFLDTSKTMVEIFKTDVCDPMDADVFIDAIRKVFPVDKVNFDLQDCDHILRIDACADALPIDSIIQLINQFGYTAEVLPDEIPFFIK